MKKISFALLMVVAVLVLTTSCKNGKLFGPKEYKVENHLDSVSYAIGLDIGNNFSKQNIDIEADALAQGIKDYLEDRALFDDKEKEKILVAFQQELSVKAREESMKKSEGARKEGEKWLNENRKKQGVIVLPSGLQYKVIKEGTGPKPKATDMVKVHYRGKLVNGTVFDASYDRGEPIEFKLNQVIPGWTEGLQLMSKGAKYELYIPSSLGYGDQGAGEMIPGGSTLIFEVELLDFHTPKPGEGEQK